MDLKFEWDESKAAGNLKKHKVSFEEAKTVFSDPSPSPSTIRSIQLMK